MKCPDCGARLAELRMEGGRVAQRCMRCGGFFMDSAAINELSAKQLELWRRISIPERWVSGGTGMCPLDGTILQKYMGEAVPKTMPAMRCARCGKWWFPRDALFDFKPAQEAKINYFRWWGVTSDLSGLVLPVLLVVMLLGGLGVGVALLQQRQQVAVPAVGVVRNFVAIDRGSGVVEVRFEADQVVSEMEFRAVVASEWWVEPVEHLEGGKYQVLLEEIPQGEYVVRIVGEEYRMKVK